MGEWTWLHALFPIADVELTQPPIDAAAANVLVRTIRAVPEAHSAPASNVTPANAAGSTEVSVTQYEVRVAPHNVSPFKGGPWLCRFTREELEEPGAALYRFRARLAEEVARARASH